MNYIYKKDMMQGYIKQIVNNEIKDEEALEGFFSDLNNDLKGFSLWIGDKFENVTRKVLDTLGKDTDHSEVLNSTKQMEIDNMMKTIIFSNFTKYLIAVPVGLKKDFPGFSYAVVNGSNGVDVRAKTLIDTTEVLLASLASGNDMAGLATAKVQILNMRKEKANYIQATTKYLQKAVNTRLFVTKAYNSPKEVSHTFGVLKGSHPLLLASYVANLVRQSRGLSDTFALIDMSKLNKGELTNLLHVMEGSVEVLEFVGLIVTDLMSCVAAMDNQHKDFTNVEARTKLQNSKEPYIMDDDDDYDEPVIKSLFS